MPEQNQIIATLLLQMTISDQKSERTLSSLVQTMVEKYGERGFAVAPDEMLHELFTRLYEEPRSVTAENDGELCLAIMNRGLRYNFSRGWNAKDLTEQVVADYGARLRPAADADSLRTFVRAALVS